ncbi:hypothetical protein [Nocardiopsis potens]|nr:hypothetical protein [Nocardiopsis potens]
MSREHEDWDLTDWLVDEVVASAQRRKGAPARPPEPKDEEHPAPEEGEQ